jgi:hypothetical protein
MRCVSSRRIFLQSTTHTHADSNVDTIYVPNKITVLQQFSTEIQRDIFTIHHTFDESKPSGQQLIRFGLNQDLAAVQCHADIRFLGDIENIYRPGR